MCSTFRRPSKGMYGLCEPPVKFQIHTRSSSLSNTLSRLETRSADNASRFREAHFDELFMPCT
jgi:hypothetical protein